MPPCFHISRYRFHWLTWQRALFLLVTAVHLLAPDPAHAVELGWTRTGKDMIFGELTEFDFEEKKLTIKVAESGKKKTFPSSQLDTRGRWLLVLSPQFHKSIPEDSSGSERLLLVFYFILIPMGLYLFVFWICAISLLGKLSPLRALIALPGAWLLSGFLIVFYLFMIGRHPEKTTVICIIGGLVTLISASLFVSIIYHKKMIHGLMLIVVHSIVTPIVLVSAIYLSYTIGDTEKVDTFFEDRLFVPVGILAGEED